MTVIAFGTVDLIINAGWGTYNELGIQTWHLQFCTTVCLYL